MPPLGLLTVAGMLLERSVHRIQKAGLEVMGGFIVGFDSDGEDIFDRQLTFIQHNAIPQAMVGLLTALPGTLLCERLAAEGRLCASASGNNTHVFQTNFRPRMGMQNLQNGYRRLLTELYGDNLRNYFERCNGLLDRLGRRLPPHRKTAGGMPQRPFAPL